MAERPANVGDQAAVTARAIEWDQDSSAQWTDRYYGFSIIEEQGDELPFSAAWGEDDAEQFATLEEAQAWCQAQIDGWIAKYAVLAEREAQPPALTDENCLRLIKWAGFKTPDSRHIALARAAFMAFPTLATASPAAQPERG